MNDHAPILDGGIGLPVQRREDLRLITGQGCYSNDVNLPGQAHAYFVRSPHAHAKILSIDASAALELEGVIAVLTGADLVADGLKSLPHRPVLEHDADVKLTNTDGSKKFVSPHLPLPPDRARFVGEAVAVIVAESIAIAKDAAEIVYVDYESLPSVTATVAAAEPDAPQVWDEHPNVALDAMIGDAEAADAAFARAAHVTSFKTQIQRLTGVPMEPRAAVAHYDPGTDRYTLLAGSGNTVRQKRELAHILGIEEARVRVVARDVGGNFGTRNAFYPEFAVLAWASKRIGRPVKWNCERQEAFLSDYQGRDLYVEAELALDAEGRFLAVRGSNLSNVGAHTVSFVPLTKGIGLMTSVYDVKAASFRGRAVNSNTPSTNSYRSAGRPEAMYVIERLIDLAAREHGFDRVELRRKNLIQPEQMPYSNALTLTYDNGAYPEVMARALELGRWDDFPRRKAEARARGKHRGIGLANYVEITSGMPRERAEVTILPEGRIEVVIGTQSSGQGHETSFAQLITEWFGIPIDQVAIITGDTDIVAAGGGSHSGRSMRLAGIVVGKASEELISRARRIAAHMMKLNSEETVRFKNGRFSASEATGTTFGIFDIAAAAEGLETLPDDLKGRLFAVGDETVRVAGYPFGSHVCEVEVDAETGVVDLVDYIAVDDVGRAINPLILHGQAHGGIAQGVGQALLELCYYDDGGQMLSGSFMDYAIPRASDLPSFITEISEIPSPTNKLGVRAGGEGGTTPALGVTINAIVDALAEFGVTHIEMPATPERVWRAIQDARSGAKTTA